MNIDYVLAPQPSIKKSGTENECLSILTTKERSIVWNQIEEEFRSKRNEVEEYLEAKNEEFDVPFCPTVQMLEENVFVILVRILEECVKKAIDTKSLRYHKSPFNAIDFIAERLWNLNPNYPDREEKNVHLYDMQWVVNTLEESPRPFFPFSWIWSQDYAATKIQAYMRGHWVRRRTEVQEVRQFWKVLARESEGEEIPRLPSVLWPYLPFYHPPDESTVTADNANDDFNI